jgi:hypothetical protein
MQPQTNQATPTPQAPPAARAPNADQNAAPMSREDIQNLRDQIRQSVRDQMGAATQDESGQGPDVPVIAAGPHNIMIRGQDGKQTIVTLPNTNDMVPPQAVDISVAFFIMIAAIIIGLPIARAFARRMDKSAPRAQVAPEVSAQLTQITQAVDAIALEVERISEGQRYTTRLLSEQRDPAHQTLTAPSDR